MVVYVTNKAPLPVPCVQSTGQINRDLKNCQVVKQDYCSTKNSLHIQSKHTFKAFTHRMRIRTKKIFFELLIGHQYFHIECVYYAAKKRSFCFSD